METVKIHLSIFITIYVLDEIVSVTVERISDPVIPAPSTTNLPSPKEKEGPSLIEKLAQLSVEQSGTGLTDIDPSTGALKKWPGGLKDIKTAHNLSVSSESMYMFVMIVMWV